MSNSLKFSPNKLPIALFLTLAVLVGASGAGLFFVGCHSSSNGGSSDSVGSEGGVVVSDDLRLVLQIPPGALAERVTIRIKTLDPELPIGSELYGLAVSEHRYQILPAGLQFNAPVRATLFPQLPSSVSLPNGAQIELRMLALTDAAGNRLLESQRLEYAVDSRSLGLSANLEGAGQIWDVRPSSAGLTAEFSTIPDRIDQNGGSVVAAVSLSSKQLESQLGFVGGVLSINGSAPLDGVNGPLILVKLGSTPVGGVVEQEASYQFTCVGAGKADLERVIAFDSVVLPEQFNRGGTFPKLDAALEVAELRSASCQ